MTPERIAAGLVSRYGAIEGYYRAQGHVITRVIESANDRAITFWRRVRNLCYANIGQGASWE